MLVWSMLPYGCESWTLGKVERDKLQAAEMLIWRRITRTSRMDKKTNEQILTGINVSEILIKAIEKRKAKCTGNLM